MRLVYPDAQLEIDLRENKAEVLSVEQIDLFTEIVQDLWKQCQGETGGWILSENEKQFQINKKINLIINPFAVSCNEKKILNKILAELDEIAQESCIEEIAGVNAGIVSCLDQIISHVNYPLDYNFDLDVTGLLKLYGIRVAEEDTDLLEKLVTYIKLSHQVCGQEVFAFVNLKSFIDNESMNMLYEEAQNEKIYIIDIESHYSGRDSDIENITIIDKDQCIITV